VKELEDTVGALTIQSKCRKESLISKSNRVVELEQKLATQEREIEKLQAKLKIARECIKSYSNCNPSPVYATETLKQLEDK
jgi:predicted RNase H-like nuclease (RuvC/YqgF family)